MEVEGRPGSLWTRNSASFRDRHWRGGGGGKALGPNTSVSGVWRGSVGVWVGAGLRYPQLAPFLGLWGVVRDLMDPKGAGPGD